VEERIFIDESKLAYLGLYIRGSNTSTGVKPPTDDVTLSGPSFTEEKQRFKVTVQISGNQFLILLSSLLSIEVFWIAFIFRQLFFIM